MSAIAILRQLCAKVRSETPNAGTNRIWRPANIELFDGGRSLLVEPLANHQIQWPSVLKLEIRTGGDLPARLGFSSGSCSGSKMNPRASLDNSCFGGR